MAQGLVVRMSWESAQGLPHSREHTLAVPIANVEPAATMRKALALVRFCDLQAAFCEADGEESLEARIQRLGQLRVGRVSLLEEMAAVGDASLQGANANLLETLDQIIDAESQETTLILEAQQQQPPPQARGGRQGKRAASASGVGPSSGAATKRGRAEPPEAYLCPLTKQLMVEPVCTADGHTYEKSAIETWLRDHQSSPLTGLRLPNKDLTPNLLMRSLLREFGAQ